MFIMEVELLLCILKESLQLCACQFNVSPQVLALEGWGSFALKNDDQQQN